jgi:site-specific DNA-methyltransferase (adenine-specific)
VSKAILRLGNSADFTWGGDGLVADPPYGIGYTVNERAMADRGHGLKAMGSTPTQSKKAIAGDDKPFDPRPWLYFRHVAFFGAQHFSDKLPSGRWLVWDKRRESKPDDHSDGDLVWMTGDSRKALRIHRQLWRGVVREGEENCSRSKKLHPNQKPVALIGAIFDLLGLEPGMTVCDPYMGSGSTAVVALRRGLNFIGSEIDPDHFARARARIEAEFGQERIELS